LFLLLAACGSGTGAPELVTQDDDQLPDLIGAATAGQMLTVGLPAPPPTAQAQGPIQVLGNSTIIVASVPFAVEEGQTIVRRGGVAVPFSSLKQGESAAVRGAPTRDGRLLAQAIDVLLVRVPLPKLALLKGPVDVQSDHVALLGQLVRVDTHTLILRAGRTVVPLSNLREGEPANLTSRPGADGSLVAMTIYLGN
jgi:hypothetical protein